MGKFVGDDVSNPIFETGVRLVFIKKYCCRPIGYKAPVFHGAHRELMNGKKVGLGKRILDVENIRKIVNRLVGVFQCEMALFLESTSGVYPDR
jgi:hypothetical protein